MKKLRNRLAHAGKEAVYRFHGSAEARGLVSVPDLADMMRDALVYRRVAGTTVFEPSLLALDPALVDV